MLGGWCWLSKYWGHWLYKGKYNQSHLKAVQSVAGYYKPYLGGIYDGCKPILNQTTCKMASLLDYSGSHWLPFTYRPRVIFHRKSEDCPLNLKKMHESTSLRFEKRSLQSKNKTIHFRIHFLQTLFCRLEWSSWNICSSKAAVNFFRRKIFRFSPHTGISLQVEGDALWRASREGVPKPKTSSGFKYFLFSPLPGEIMTQSD